MPRNGSGQFSLVNNSWNPATAGNLATSGDWQSLINDIATALTQSVSRDGQTPITGNLQMGNNKITGLTAGSGTGQAVSFEQLFNQGTEQDLASAATTDIGAQLTNFLRITGTTTITSFGTNYKGPRFLRFAGAVTLTNSSTLILPGGANITTAAGDCCIAIPKATLGTADGWQVVAYQKNAVPGAIPDGSVTTAKIADSSVTTAKIADGSVTTAKLADAAVTRAKAADGVVGGWKGVTSLSSNTTLTSADAGKYIAISAASLSIQINTSTLTAGDRFHFNGNGGSCTLTRTDGGNFVSYGNLTTASLSVTDGNGISMFWDGANFIIENNSLNIQRQTWTDVTASRALATSYTNTTGKPIVVNVWAYSGGTNGNKQLNIYVNSVVHAVSGMYSTTGNNYPFASVVVPAGATYSADTFGSNISISLSGWRELR